ncbi:MAG TPA: dihydrofolate reductase family protein [Puia sp.]|nr:dihydrofolate reductase family protein [Puia sp.]
MRRVTVFNFITLNGYFQGPDGDISWHRREEETADYSDEKSQQGNTLLFGRVTYQHMAAFWPTPAAKQLQPVTADGMNKAEKIVFSRTLNKADWNNTRLIKEDLIGSVRRLKQEPGSDITVLGSGSIVTQLADAGLVDGYGFMIDPVALGEGVPVFKGIKNKLDLKLTSSKVFKSGVIMVTYEPIKL